MSNSELSDAGPSHDVLEQELRQVVRGLCESGNLEDLTVKRVRLAAEKSLNLEDGFYKSDEWKARSKDIIEAEAKAQTAAKEKAPAKPPKSPSTVAPKRKSPAKPVPSKRQKTGAASRPVAAKARVESSSELSEPDILPAEATTPAKPPQTKEPAAEQSSSELSELIDDEPAPKKKLGTKRKKEAPKPSAKPKPKSTGSKGAAETDANADEIKKLQGWLAKCGIRKVWGKELKTFDTPQAKIQHLKGMLADVGMTGRYSIEKAQRIREMRELQADLEAVQEGAKYWGKSDEDEDRGDRRRRLARGSFGGPRKVVKQDAGDEEEDEEEAAGEKQGQSRVRDESDKEASDHPRPSSGARAVIADDEDSDD